MSDGLCTLNSTWAPWFCKCSKPSIETFHRPKIGTKWLFCPPIHISKLAFCWVSLILCGLGPHSGPSGPYLAIFARISFLTLKAEIVGLWVRPCEPNILTNQSIRPNAWASFTGLGAWVFLERLSFWAHFTCNSKMPKRDQQENYATTKSLTKTCNQHITRILWRLS